MRSRIPVVKRGDVFWALRWIGYRRNGVDSLSFLLLQCSAVLLCLPPSLFSFHRFSFNGQ